MSIIISLMVALAGTAICVALFDTANRLLVHGHGSYLERTIGVFCFLMMLTIAMASLILIGWVLNVVWI